MIRTITCFQRVPLGLSVAKHSICRPGLGGRFPAPAAAGTSPSGAPLGHAGGRPRAGLERHGPALPSGPVDAAGGCAGTGEAVKSRADRDGYVRGNHCHGSSADTARTIARGAIGRGRFRRGPCGLAYGRPVELGGRSLCSLRAAALRVRRRHSSGPPCPARKWRSGGRSAASCPSEAGGPPGPTNTKGRAGSQSRDLVLGSATGPVSARRGERSRRRDRLGGRDRARAGALEARRSRDGPARRVGRVRPAVEPSLVVVEETSGVSDGASL